MQQVNKNGDELYMGLLSSPIILSIVSLTLFVQGCLIVKGHSTYCHLARDHTQFYKTVEKWKVLQRDHLSAEFGGKQSHEIGPSTMSTLHYHLV